MTVCVLPMFLTGAIGVQFVKWTPISGQRAKLVVTE